MTQLLSDCYCCCSIIACVEDYYYYKLVQDPMFMLILKMVSANVTVTLTTDALHLLLIHIP